MRRLLFFFFLLLTSLVSEATHIVGGGFDYRNVGGANYQFRLTLFFDEINGNPAARDDDATCYIFSKSSNELIETVFMPLSSSDGFLPFTNPLCSINSPILTRILVYESIVSLPAASYSDPEGYYIIWERCCRNHIVTNIIDPGGSGQTFYMEFPPVWRNGAPFQNASPDFVPINSDYPCIQELFSLSFEATDADGDSLAYSLVDPLIGNSTSTAPKNIPAIPAPYAVVEWSSGFSALNAIPGNPALNVNAFSGLVQCKPGLTGLFVFSVKCEEFRYGVKIGEVRREMQLLVKDCQANTPPVLSIKNQEGVLLNSNDTLSLFSSASRICYTYKISEKQLDQQVKLRILPLNSVIPNFFADTTLSFSPGRDTVSFNFCIPKCTVTPDGQPWKILILATDNGCPIPKSDTLELSIEIDQTPLEAPEIQMVTSGSDTLSTLQTEKLEIQFQATQSQNGPISFTSYLTDSLGNPIPISANGIILPSGLGVGSVQSSFLWPEICFLPSHQPLKLTTIAQTLICNQSKYDTTYSWIFIKPKNPEVRIESEYQNGNAIELKMNEQIDFKLNGFVSEQRVVRLDALGNLTAIPGFSFPAVSATDSATSAFRMQTNCSSPGGGFSVTFLASNTFCNVEFKDTVNYVLHLIPDSDSLGLVPNLITNNQDGRNDGFSLEKIQPADNCLLNFDFIEIYNRWGAKTFFSRDRNFLWKPVDGESGMFFFALHFKERTLKDWVLVTD